MRARLAPGVMLGISPILLCAVLAAGLPVPVSTASERLSLASDEQNQQAQNSSQRRASQADDPSFRVYLPLIMKHFVPGIHGQVTHQGTAAAGVAVHLWLCHSSSCSEAFTTTTNGDGIYAFVGVPSLGVDQRYYVRFGPNTAPAGDSRYLSNWYGPDILSYTTGDSIAGGDFDIADVAPLNIAFLGPCIGAKVFLPALFSWQPRQLAAETYRLLLSNPVTGEIVWDSADLGNVGSYGFDSLPPGLALDQTYNWRVNVYSASKGFGSSFAQSQITFSPAVQSGIYGRVTYKCAGAGGIVLLLWFHDGAAWSNVAITTTSADGTYIFPFPPSLMVGQTYRVGFGPNQDPTGNSSYVYRWYGPDITSYTVGTAVPGGSNDIANIQLLSPAVEATVLLPAQFEWQRRQVGSESYQWVLFNPLSPSTVWKTAILGDVGTYQLVELPAGFTPGARYGWYVNAHSSADGYVISYYHRGIRFSMETALPVGNPPGPQGLEVPGDLMGEVPSREK